MPGKPLNLMPPVHPGEVYVEDFLGADGDYVDALAALTGCTPEFWRSLRGAYEAALVRESLRCLARNLAVAGALRLTWDRAQDVEREAIRMRLSTLIQWG